MFLEFPDHFLTCTFFEVLFEALQTIIYYRIYLHKVCFKKTVTHLLLYTVADV